jgi:orotidine-5'-phosphate decarboxylase
MTGLILALDVVERERALDIAKKTSRFLDYIKVNYPLVLSCGIEIIGELKRYSEVIADFKIADIPYTSSLISRIAFQNGAKGIICHGFVGSDTIKAVLSIAKEYGGEVYVVTELSSDGGREYLQGHSNSIAVLSKNIGCHGLVAPATRPDRIKEIKELTDMKILAPGVGAQGGKIKEAILAGADYLIVGRSIYDSEDPKESAEEIRREIDEVTK